MKARDVRAIAFCLVSTLVVAAGSIVLLQSYLLAGLFTVVFDFWLLTRARMVRVIRRLRGAPDWSHYFRE
jgi:hypothetical protein